MTYDTVNQGHDKIVQFYGIFLLEYVHLLYYSVIAARVFTIIDPAKLSCRQEKEENMGVISVKGSRVVFQKGMK